MSKRKNRKNAPNLPKAALERARAQARGEEYVPPEPVVEDEMPEEDEEEVEATDRADRRNERRSRRRTTPAQYSKRRSDGEPLTNDALETALARPTKFVSEEELHEEYGHVVTDIRNMFVLAAVLMVLLVALAQFI
jgi:hypothetical protein